MKKFFMFTVFLIVMSAAMIAQAGVAEESFSFTPFAGGYSFEGNEYQRSSYTVGLRAGYNITEHIGVEGYFHYVPTELRDVPDEPWQNVYGYGVEGLYHFFPDGRFVPFVAIGVGIVHYGYPEQYRTTRFALEYGGGLKYFLSTKVANYFFADNIALRADVRHVMPFNDRYNDLLCTFGIEFSFGAGGKEKITPKEPTSKSEEVVPQAEALAPVATVPADIAVAPAVTVNTKQNEMKALPEEDIKNLVTNG
jgi:OOP family OmpA-OmpF porin